MGFLEAAVAHAFLQKALLAGVLASVGCGVTGAWVVVKRIGYLAGGIAHSVLGGMGVAYFLDASPVTGAMVAAVLAALIIGWVSLRWREQEDTIIGALWAGGMAVGLIFISRTPGYSVDLMSYLFGNILIVGRGDLYLMAGVDAAAVALVLLLRKQFLAVAFDEEFAALRGVPVKLFYMLLLCLVAVTVVTLIRVVGLILVIALLTMPAAIARQHVSSLGAMMLVGTLLGAVFTTGGLAVSYGPDLPAGATMVLLAAVAYLGSTVFVAGRRRRRINAARPAQGSSADQGGSRG